MWYPTEQGRVVSITNQLILKQPWKVSNVQEQQWTKNTTLWHTRYDINTRTTHTIYLNSLSTTGQKILEHRQDQATNSSFCILNTRPLWLTLPKAALKSIWTNASSPPLSNSNWPAQTMSRRASQVPKPFLYEYWWDDRTPDLSKKRPRRKVINLSITFDRTSVIEICR